MHASGVVLERQFNAGYQFKTGAVRCRSGSVDALQGVVIGQGKGSQTRLEGQLNQVGRLLGAVRCRRVGMEVYRH